MARALQRNLEDAAEVAVWDQDLNAPTRSVLDNVLAAIRNADFAALVLTADDSTTVRGRRRRSVRDNVVFELGIAFGALGPGRTFFLVPRDDPPTILADLTGVQAVTYPAAGERGWVPAVGGSAGRIAHAMEQMSPGLTSTLMVDPADWVQRLPAGPLSAMFLETGPDSQRDLVERLRGATERINIFGLTRNFFARPDVSDLLHERSQSVPVRLYLMDPSCVARVERYRVEPTEAALEDPARMVREILGPLRALVARSGDSAVRRGGRGRSPGVQVYLYNFPCSFGIEEIDGHCRVMLYGHGKRGTQGPIMVFPAGTPYHDYFASQIRWLEMLAAGESLEPWAGKGVRVVPLERDAGG